MTRGIVKTLKIRQSAAKNLVKKLNKKIFSIILMNIGEIYCLTSPSNKKYVGQCVKLLSSGKKWGHLYRWKQHIRDATIGKDNCRLLNNAIRKYNSENFTIELIMECDIKDLDYNENLYIEQLNTMTPNGYNLTSGKTTSRQSDETKELRRESMIGKNLGKVLDKRPRQRNYLNIFVIIKIHLVKKDIE